MIARIDKEKIRNAIITELNDRIDHAHKLLAASNDWEEAYRFALEKSERLHLVRLETFLKKVKNLTLKELSNGEPLVDGTIWVVLEEERNIVTHHFYVGFDPPFLISTMIDNTKVLLACSNTYNYTWDMVGRSLTLDVFYDRSVVTETLLALY